MILIKGDMVTRVNQNFILSHDKHLKYIADMVYYGMAGERG